MKHFTEFVVTVIGVIGLVAIIGLLVSLPVWLLWNWLMPVIFGVKTISWLQALGLIMLCQLLFSSNKIKRSK